MLLFGFVELACGASYTAQASGNWSTTTTWSPNGTPGAGDTVSIGAFTITLTGATSIDGVTFTGAGDITGSTLTLTNAATVTVNGGVIGTIDSIIAGTAGLTLSGGGTLKVTATNTYTGTTLISAGTLTISGATGSINASTQVTIADGATLGMDSTSTYASGRLCATGTITLKGGTLTWTGPASNVTETIATLQFSAKHSVVHLQSSNAANSVTLTATNALSRQNSATMELQRNATGTGTLKTGDTNATILRWTSVFDSARTPVAYFVGKYDSTNGLVQIGQISGNTFVSTLGGAWTTAATWSTNPTAGSPVAGDSIEISGAGSLVGVGGGSQACCTEYLASNTTGVNQGGTVTLTGNIYVNAPNCETSNSLNFSSGEGVLIVSPGDDFTNVNNAFASTTPFTLSGGGVAKMGGGGAGSSVSWTTPIVIVKGKVKLNQTTTPLGSSTGITIYDGGALDLNGITLGAIPATINSTGYQSSGAIMTSSTTACTYSGAITLASNSSIDVISAGQMTLSGAIGGSFSLTKTSSGMLILSGSNAWTGSTTISDGTLRVSGGAAIPDTSTVTTANLATAILDLNGTSETIGGLAGGGNLGGNVTLGAGTLTIGGSATTTYDGVISGTGALTVAGSGALTLTRASSYTGTTTIGSGTLYVNATNSSSAVSLTSTGLLGGTGRVGAIASTAGCNGGTVEPGTASAKGTLLASSANLSLGTNATVKVRVAAFTTAGTDYDRLDLATAGGSLTLGGSSKIIVDLSGVSGAGTASGVITCSSRSGTFASVATVNAPAGYAVTIVYNSGSVDVMVDSAATTTWLGTTSAAWATSANWGNGVPDTAHLARYVSAYSNPCTVGSGAYALGVSIQSGYASTITQGAGFPLYCGPSGFVMASSSATFSCGDTLFTPTFNQSAGTFSGTGTVYLVGPSGGSLTAVSTLPNLEVEGLDTGLVAYWKLDETSGTTAYDATWNGYNGTYTNNAGSGAPVVEGTIKPTLIFADPQSRKFTQTSKQTITVGDAAALRLTGNYTYAAWCRPNNPTNQQFLFDKTSGANDGYLANITTTANFYAHHRDGTNDDQTAPAASTNLTGVWQHFAGSWDGATVHSFKDGAAVGSFATVAAAASETATLYLGSDGSINAVDGYLDDVRMYSRALSEAEIWSLQQGLGGDATQATTFTLGSNITVSGTCKVDCGTLALGTSTLSVGGSCTVYGLVSGTSGTIALTGTGSGKTLRCGEARLPNLTVNSSDGTGVWTLQDRLDLVGTLAIQAGQLDVSASNYTIRCGTLNQTGAATTLVPRSGTIVMDSSSGGAITASTTLNALRIEGADETGLIGYWKFDKQTGFSHYDYSGNGHTATLQGGAMHSTSTPPATLFENGGCATLDGSDDYLTVANSAGMNATAITIAAWVNPSSVSSIRHDIVNKWGASGNYSYNFQIDDTGHVGGNVSPDGTTDNWATGATVLSTGTWYHVAMTYDGAALKIWLNGSLDGATQMTGAIFSTTEPVLLGHMDPAFASGRWYAGLLDDVRIYSRALLPSEIRNLANGRYANGANGTPTWTLGANLQTASLGIDAGTFNANGFTTTLSGAFTMNDGQGTYVGGSNTQTFNGGFTMNGGTFTGGTGMVAVTGNFTMAAPTDTNGGIPETGGTFTAPSLMTVTANLALGAGTFTAGSGIVRLIGSGAGNTLTGVNAAGGGLVGSVYASRLNAVTQDDWRTTQSITGERLDAPVGFLGDAPFSPSTLLRAAYEVGGTDAQWNNYSVQWDGWITIPVDGTTLKTRSDDSSRVWIDANGDGVVKTGEWGSNNWGNGQAAYTNVIQYLMPKGTYRIRVQYEQGTGADQFYLAWDDATHATAGQTPDGDYIVPSAFLTPARGGGLMLNSLQVTGSGSWTVNSPIYATGSITCTAGTLTQATSSWISASGGWTQNGGTFTGSSGTTVNDNVTIGGDFSCTSGTFTSTKASFNVGGNFSVSGTGTFAHNSGTLELRPTGTKTITCTQTLNHLRLNDSLVAYWNFDESASPASDLTGRGHDATWYSAPTPSTTNLPPIDASDPRSMALNGTSQYLAPARQTDFILPVITVSAWAYVPSSSGWPNFSDIIDRQGPGNVSNGGNGVSGWGLETLNGGWRFFDIIGGNFKEADSQALTADTWHHVAGTCDGSTIRIYVDGILHQATAIAATADDIIGLNVGIGRNEWGSHAGFLSGTIDELRVYNRALTPGEIHRLGNRHDPGSTVNSVQLGSALTVAGDVILLSGALDASPGFDMTVTGNWTNRGGVFTPGTRTVTLNTAGSINVRSGNQPFYNLTLSGSGTYTAVDQMRTTGTLTLSTGTFVAPSTRLVCLGNFTVSGGTFTNNGGTLIMKSQTGSTLTCSQSLNNVVFTDGLIAQWEFEESSTPSLDISGWNHSATWTSAPTSDAANKPGLQTANTRSLQFNGTYTTGAANYLTVTDGFEFLPASKLTIATWVYLTASSNVDEGQIFGRMGDSGDPSNPGSNARCYNLMTVGAGPGLQMRVNSSQGNGGNVYYASQPLSAWHHLATVADGTNLTMYLDGLQVATTALGAYTITDAVNQDGMIWIGRNSYYRGFGGFHPSFNGEIDDLRFYDRDLSVAEIGRLASGREAQTSAATFSLGSNLTINGNLTIGSGTLDFGTRTVTLAGSYRCEGKVTGTTGTLALNSSASNTLLCGNQAIPNVTVAGSGTWTCSDWFKTTGTYAQSGTSTFAGNGKPVTIGGNLTVSAGALIAPTSEVLACGGGFTDGGGSTFQANAGVLEMTSATNQSLNAACIYNHLWIASAANNGLVARFRLDEGQFGTACDDVSGVAATPGGLPTTSPGGAPTASSATPSMATNDPSCADFSGATSGSGEQYLSVANSTALDTLNLSSYSISAWFWPRALPAGPGSINSYYGLVMKKFPHGGLIYGPAGQIYLNHYLSDGVTFGQAVSNSTYAPGSWYHLCGVVDVTAGSVKLYINGALAGAGTFTGGAASYNYGSEQWTIGIAAPGDASWMWPTNGRIDDVRFYSRALSAQEALALSSNGLDSANGTATFTLAHAASIAGDVDLIGGTLAAAGLGISASQSWRNLVGTSGFSAGGDTVTLNGTSQQLYGSTTFASLTKQVAAAATLTLPVYECQNVTGTLTLNGASGQLLSIRSSIPGSMATINPTGSRVCSFLDVQDSRNFCMPIINPASSNNSGDTRWWFGPQKGNGVLIASPPVE